MKKRYKFCSSCGAKFEDKDEQGNEGVYCRKCAFAIMRKIVDEYQWSFELVLDALSGGFRLKFKNMPSKQKREVINRFREKGIITFEIDGIQKNIYDNIIRNR